MTENFLCIHGHFYQPPRENPWLDVIEFQISAKPHHDWNQRITRECYGPNTRARLHGPEGRIIKLLNNYEYMSFNFGPTLLAWLEKTNPWVYSQILAADRKSLDRYDGHGNAMAQVYNHIIMPLADRRDKITQIRWGLADFKHRFGREAEGMWLAETAVDSETLGLMADEGVKFTILSPTQAQSVRPLAQHQEDSSWLDVSGGRIDITRPYRVLLDESGRRFIDVFFYDADISRAVAYEKILASGENFLARFEKAFAGHQNGPQLVSIATDGESYGHHFKFGDLALSWLFDHLEESSKIKLTNYGFFVERFQPAHEVRLIENSSWSCAHGVERWRSDCGCSVSHNEGWNQAWRGPLREGLEWLAGKLAFIFEGVGGQLFKDPWAARNDYIRVLLQPSANERELFLKDHMQSNPGAEERIEAFQLLESQRMALYMFTSCGWFFDDISGLEATQVLKYAARALDLVHKWSRPDLERQLINFLVRAKSNDPAYKHGGEVYQLLVIPSRIDSSRAVGHHALLSLANGLSGSSGSFGRPQQNCLFSEIIRPVAQRLIQGQGQHMIAGEARVAEMGTGREEIRAYVAYRKHGKDIICLVGEPGSKIDLEDLAEKMSSSLREGAWDDIEALFSRHIRGVRKYIPKDLLLDSRKCLVECSARSFRERIIELIGEEQQGLEGLRRLLEETEEPIPEILEGIFRLMLSEEFEKLVNANLESQAIDWAALRHVAEQAESLGILLNGPNLKESAKEFLIHMMGCIPLAPEEISIRNVIDFLNLAEELNLELDLWQCQNMFYDLYNDKRMAGILSADLIAAFRELGRRLGFSLGGE
jgi:alpha-amylase/alpha-mannosidase (GH57 family)